MSISPLSIARGGYRVPVVEIIPPPKPTTVKIELTLPELTVLDRFFYGGRWPNMRGAEQDFADLERQPGPTAGVQLNLIHNAVVQALLALGGTPWGDPSTLLNLNATKEAQ